MALTLIKERGVGLVDATAYANAADGDAYHDGHLYATAWTGASAANKDVALVMATRLIDGQYQFNGAKANEAQALQWPLEGCPDPDADGWNGGTVAEDVVPKAVVEATCMYTNNPPCGAMRGFGAPQVCFAYEAQMDKLAGAVGIDPVELRLKNVLATGSTTITGRVIQSSAPVRELIERCLTVPMPAEAAASAANSA